jgi:hypothetical protein
MAASTKEAREMTTMPLLTALVFPIAGALLLAGYFWFLRLSRRSERPGSDLSR